MINWLESIRGNKFKIFFALWIGIPLFFIFISAMLPPFGVSYAVGFYFIMSAWISFLVMTILFLIIIIFS
jgi:hypothetical protein